MSVQRNLSSVSLSSHRSARRIARDRDDAATSALAEAAPRISQALAWDTERKRIAEVIFWALCRLNSRSVTLSRTRRRELADLLGVGEGYFIRGVDDLHEMGLLGVLRVDGRRTVAAWVNEPHASSSGSGPR